MLASAGGGLSAVGIGKERIWRLGDGFGVSEEKLVK